jgi:hypothetical protein
MTTFKKNGQEQTPFRDMTRASVLECRAGGGRCFGHMYHMLSGFADSVIHSDTNWHHEGGVKGVKGKEK